MSLRTLLAPTRIALDVAVDDVDGLLARLAQLLADEDPARSDDILASLRQRERLGSTAIGHGVALPHGRNDVFDEARAAFVRLARPLELDAVDGEAVDLVLALSVPAHFTRQHLQLLAEIAERFIDAGFRDALRTAHDTDAAHALLAQVPPP
ncbi:PTS sugar transporter subunit IIA [Luteimonas sp. e5]